MAVLLLLLILTTPHTIEIVNEPIETPTPVPTPRLVQLILDTAAAHKIDGERFLATARCESGLKSDAIGDGGNSYGLFQIHLPAHPNVTAEQALDPNFAVEWSAQKFKINPLIWTCYRTLYGS